MDTKNLKENHFIIPPDEKRKFFESLKRKPSALPRLEPNVPSFAEWQKERDERLGRFQETPDKPEDDPEAVLRAAWDKLLSKIPPWTFFYIPDGHYHLVWNRSKLLKRKLRKITASNDKMYGFFEDNKGPEQWLGFLDEPPDAA
jgi:hypothetical protein